MAYAVVRTGGKQYRVEEGSVLGVGPLAGEPGTSVTLGEVLLIAADDEVGDAAKARVTAEIVAHGRGEKIKVFRYKNKVRSRKTMGSRAKLTTIKITKIEV